MGTVSTVYFPQLKLVDVDALQGPDVQGAVVGEEIRIAAFPANGRATSRTEGVHHALLTELVLGHAVFTGDPLKVALEWIDH